MNSDNDYKIEVFIPETHTRLLMDELAGAGVGRMGAYEYCFSVSAVQGFWRPLEGAQPYQGTAGEISQAPENKLEVNCREAEVRAALQAIRRVHPYEQPPVNILPLANRSFLEDR